MKVFTVLAILLLVGCVNNDPGSFVLGEEELNPPRGLSEMLEREDDAK